MTMGVDPPPQDGTGAHSSSNEQSDTTTNPGGTTGASGKTSSAQKLKFRVDFTHPTAESSSSRRDRTAAPPFDAPKALKALLQTITAAGAAFQIHSKDSNSSIAKAEDIPDTQADFASIFDVVQQWDRIAMGFTATTVKDIPWFKQGKVLQYLTANNVWLNANHFETLQLAECGRLLQ